jgi:anti-anti-sigma factor
VEDGIGALAHAGASVFPDRPSACLRSSIQSLASQIEELDGGVFVLRGEFDAFMSPQLEREFEAAVERGVYDLLVDMCEVEFVDMSTLNVVVRAMKEVYRHNGHLVVACAQRNVLRAIDLAGLRHAVLVYETREAAAAALNGRR